MSGEEDDRVRRRAIRIVLALRGITAFVLAVGAAVLALRREWPAVAFCIALIAAAIALAYRDIRRLNRRRQSGDS